MKIAYTGRQVELAPAQLKKLEAKFAKTGRLLDGRRESEAHVILSLERHLHQAEATVNYYGNQLVGVGSSSDLFTAIQSAADKLEKQAGKVRTKWRDNKRVAKAPREPESEQPDTVAEVEAEAEPAPEQRIYHVNHPTKRKPMTLDEAILEMEKKRDYLVYRDADSDRLHVLVRRRDGGFDLVEG
jgi:putative sigma-54 modulation protein